MVNKIKLKSINDVYFKLLLLSTLQISGASKLMKNENNFVILILVFSLKSFLIKMYEKDFIYSLIY